MPELEQDFRSLRLPLSLLGEQNTTLYLLAIQQTRLHKCQSADHGS